ncbi:MAG: HEPN domain-containing protein [Acidobacteria bacterium]|nr:HEPN domain-containing protein [Acidobacteriota bacterium]
MSSNELLDEVRRWLRFAREDLEAAETLTTEAGFRPRHVCWLAQQAAEKALKGALTLQQIAFPFRHDLDALRNLLPEGWQVKVRHPDLAELTEWAVEARYPGDWPEATADDARHAAEQARGVYESVRSDLVRYGVQLEESLEHDGDDTA